MTRAACIQFTLALIDVGLSRPQAVFEHLAGDLEEALRAYEQAYPVVATDVRRVDVRRALVSINELHLMSDGKVDPETLHGLEVAGNPHAASDGLGTMLGNLDTDLPIYAIACTDDAQATSAIEALDELERICHARGIVYRGGVAVAGGRLVAPCAHGPRMGRMRRGRSEAIDRLTLAIRSGCAVGGTPACDDTSDPFGHTPVLRSHPLDAHGDVPNSHGRTPDPLDHAPNSHGHILSPRGHTSNLRGRAPDPSPRAIVARCPVPAWLYPRIADFYERGRLRVLARH